MKKSSLTQLEKEQKLKHIEGELTDELSILGQDSDTKAAKWIIEKHNEQEVEDRQEKAIKLDHLASKRKGKIFTYKEQLAVYLQDMLRGEHFPKTWHWEINITDHGLLLRVFNELGFSQSRKFRITGDPKYDLHACVNFAYWAGDVVFLMTDSQAQSMLKSPHV